MRAIAAAKNKVERPKATKPKELLPVPAYSEIAMVELRRRYMKKDEKGK
jgi:hypothetical protein